MVAVYKVVIGRVVVDKAEIEWVAVERCQLTKRQLSGRQLMGDNWKSGSWVVGNEWLAVRGFHKSTPKWMFSVEAGLINLFFLWGNLKFCWQHATPRWNGMLQARSFLRSKCSCFHQAYLNACNCLKIKQVMIRLMSECLKGSRLQYKLPLKNHRHQFASASIVLTMLLGRFRGHHLFQLELLPVGEWIRRNRIRPDWIRLTESAEERIRLETNPPSMT